jgi:hypothetical protein
VRGWPGATHKESRSQSNPLATPSELEPTNARGEAGGRPPATSRAPGVVVPPAR